MSCFRMHQTMEELSFRVKAYADAGAYGHAMASHYNLRGLPAEDIIDDPAG